MEKYLVDIEFRYCGWDNDENRLTHHSKTVTIGIFDTYDEAAKAGNAMLGSQLESRFPLNKAWNRKERFGKYDNKYLISDMAYLQTPFSFFAHIKRLDFSSVSDAIDKALESEKEYRNGKAKEND